MRFLRIVPKTSKFSHNFDTEHVIIKKWDILKANFSVCQRTSCEYKRTGNSINGSKYCKKGLRIYKNGKKLAEGLIDSNPEKAFL